MATFITMNSILKKTYIYSIFLYFYDVNGSMALACFNVKKGHFTIDIYKEDP